MMALYCEIGKCISKRDFNMITVKAVRGLDPFIICGRV